MLVSGLEKPPKGEVMDMARKRHATEQIINHLHEAEVELSRGKNIAEICRQLSICEQTFYRWK
jgi:putative transposase